MKPAWALSEAIKLTVVKLMPTKITDSEPTTGYECYRILQPSESFSIQSVLSIIF